VAHVFDVTRRPSAGSSRQRISYPLCRCKRTHPAALANRPDLSSQPFGALSDRGKHHGEIYSQRCPSTNAVGSSRSSPLTARRRRAANPSPCAAREMCTSLMSMLRRSAEDYVSEDWSAVAKAVNERLTELGLNQRELAERSHQQTRSTTPETVCPPAWPRSRISCTRSPSASMRSNVRSARSSDSSVIAAWAGHSVAILPQVYAK
jgi:hypothetical protein